MSYEAIAESSLQHARRWRSLLLNFAVVAVLYEFYEFTRGLIPRNGAIAIEHADTVWAWEVRHGLFVEPAWQQFLLGRAHFWGWLQVTPARVADFLNTGYLYVHFIGTILFLFWLFFFRRALFPFVRNIFFLSTAIALAIYALYPLAPPRLTPNILYENKHYVFIDTVREVLDPKYQTTQIGYNPYAAMPSLHFAWALIIGTTLVCTLRFWPLRILAAFYPVFMLTVIIGSGNHFFADALASTGVVIFSTATVFTVMRGRTELWPRVQSVFLAVRGTRLRGA